MANQTTNADYLSPPLRRRPENQLWPLEMMTPVMTFAHIPLLLGQRWDFSS